YVIHLLRRRHPESCLFPYTTLFRSYDFLVLAPGGETNAFGLESVARHATGLKELRDAVAIRNRLLRLFELASQCDDPEERRAMRSEEHTSELQSRDKLVCRLLLVKK